MYIPFALEYFLFTLVGAFATIQIAGALVDKPRLRILKNQSFTILLSLLVITMSFVWFFSIRDRNVQTYMEGAQISGIFMISTFLSLVVTKITKRIYGHH